MAQSNKTIVVNESSQKLVHSYTSGVVINLPKTFPILSLICITVVLGLSNLLDIKIFHFKQKPTLKRVALNWQEITEIGGQDFVGNGNEHFVYSAYQDFYMNQDIIRVIAVTPSHSGKILFCHIFDENLSLMDTILGEIRTTLDPQSNMMYSAASIICPIYPGISNVANTEFIRKMKYLSVLPTASIKSHTSNLLHIIHTSEEQEKHAFGLCVQPTFKFDNVSLFLQWMEFYKMMGVSHFTFYNISIGPRVSCLMKSAAVNEEIKIEVLDWAVPISNNSLLHVNAQVSQANDCAFRYRGVANYTVMVDFDEYITPNYTIARNYQELINHIHTELVDTGTTAAQYQFRTAFFAFEYGSLSNSQDNLEEYPAQLHDLLIFNYIRRQRELFGYGVRSKIITRPKYIIEPGVHGVDEAVGNAKEFQVPSGLAFVHHYRLCSSLSPLCAEICSKDEQEVDTSAHFFAIQLLTRLQNMRDKLNNECLL